MARPIGLMLPLLTLLGLCFVVPLLLLAAYASAGPDLFGNYAEILADRHVVRVLLATLRLGVEVVLGATLLGLPLALCFWHAGPRGRLAIFALTLIPLLTSNVVRTFAWIVLLGREGPINSALLAAGVIDSPMTLVYTHFGVVLALSQIELPLLLLPVFAVFVRSDKRLEDAAMLAGAGRWRIAATVILPQALPGLLAGWVLVFASATTSYVTQAAIGGGRLPFAPQLIYRQVSLLFEWPQGAAVALILLAAAGSVVVGLALLARHPRLAANA